MCNHEKDPAHVLHLKIQLRIVWDMEGGNFDASRSCGDKHIDAMALYLLSTGKHRHDHDLV
jgi:hypothetical protein